MRKPIAVLAGIVVIGSAAACANRGATRTEEAVSTEQQKQGTTTPGTTRCQCPGAERVSPPQQQPSELPDAGVTPAPGTSGCPCPSDAGTVQEAPGAGGTDAGQGGVGGTGQYGGGSGGGGG